MGSIYRVLVVGGSVLWLAGCGDNSSPAAATAPSTQQQVKEDLKAAGQEVKDAGRAIADKADPALEKAREEAKELVHKGAEKVSAATGSTQPGAATQP